MSIWRSYVESEVIGERIPVCTLGSGIEVYRRGRSLVVPLNGTRAVLSSAEFNGGYMCPVGAVFNTTGLGGEAERDLMGSGRSEYGEYVRLCAERIGLDPDTSVGLGTAVTMDKAAVVTERKGVTEVTAIVTAGVEGNGGRAGDPASYDQTEKYVSKKGTIVIILIVEADLPVHSMARAIMTATEAKTCALQQLMARSVYSTGIASGSGTDQIAVVCDRSSDIHLTDAGKHSVLGELIGRAVIKGVTKALDNWAGLNPMSQHDALKRVRRYGIDEESILEEAGVDDPQSREILESACRDGRVVSTVASVVHILDEIDWGLLGGSKGSEIGGEILRSTLYSDLVPSGDLLLDLKRSLASLIPRR